jgi:hypothetical protein
MSSYTGGVNSIDVPCNLRQTLPEQIYRSNIPKGSNRTVLMQKNCNTGTVQEKFPNCRQNKLFFYNVTCMVFRNF